MADERKRVIAASIVNDLRARKQVAADAETKARAFIVALSDDDANAVRAKLGAQAKAAFDAARAGQPLPARAPNPDT